MVVIEIDFPLTAELVIAPCHRSLPGVTSRRSYVVSTIDVARKEQLLPGDQSSQKKRPMPETFLKMQKSGRLPSRIRLEYNQPGYPLQTPMWSGSTELCVMNGCHGITGTISRKFRCSPLTGCGNTITTTQIWLWAVSPTSSDWSWPHNRPTSRFSTKRGNYRPAHKCFQAVEWLYQSIA